MINSEDRAESSLPRCVCGWKNCRNYQKAWREKNVDIYNGVIKLKFSTDHPESQALKTSIDRTLGVPEAKRNDWKASKTNGVFFIKYTIARHHYTKKYLQKVADTPNFDFFKPFSIHGARKYLFSVDPQETLIANDQVLYLQTPNVSKEHVKTEFHTVMQSNTVNKLSKAELENKMLKEQLDAMKSQLTFLHDMVQKLQEQHFDSHTVNSRRSSRKVPTEIHLEEESESTINESTEGEWTDAYESNGNIGNNSGHQSFQRKNSITSYQSRSTIVSASKSVKTLPREIELDEDEDAESLEQEAFDNRSFASSVHNSRRRSSNKSQKSRRSSADKHSRRTSNSSGSDVSNYKVSEIVVTDPYGEKGLYTGTISKGTAMPNGYGKLEYDKPGRWYEGDWKQGRWTGKGKLSNGDGDFYEGELKNDHKHGQGVMKFADGRTFEGVYDYGQMVDGKMTYQDGSTYSGSWVDGMRHGFGKCVFTDESIYEGEFREGEFYGRGKMTWNDGGWYSGQWSAGEMHGLGKEVRADGSLRHDGEWVKGQPIRN